MFSRYAMFVVLAALTAAPVAAQTATEKASEDKPAKGNPLKSTSAYLDALRRNTTTAGKVALAEAAGPREIARAATIVEMTATGSKVLREGTNGWTCIADPKGPMCLDATFMGWAGAWMNKLQPNVTKVGFAYMLVGDEGASLTDPYATAPTADWIKSGAHTMMIVPDAAQLDALPDNPSKGGPYVMWKGTPYAHVMVPAN